MALLVHCLCLWLSTAVFECLSDTSHILSPSHSLHLWLAITYHKYQILDCIWGFEIGSLSLTVNTNRINLPLMNMVSCCTYYIGESSLLEVKIEAENNDMNDITEHPHDDKPRPYLCTVCDKQFTNKNNLNAHRTLHTGEKLYACTQCDKHFPSKRYLSFHMNVHSSKYSCTECGKCFRGNPELTKHRRIHTGEKPFECAVCSKRFAQSAELARHVRIHSGEKPYKCLMCDKSFSVSGNLKTHMRVHTGDKPYKCSLCNKSFSRSSTLQRHKCHVHSNRRPYVCRYCGKLFKSSGELKFHARIHADAKPYSCIHCSDRFTWRRQLKTHLLKSHNEGICSCVTFVIRNSARMVTLRHICFVVTIWRCVFAVKPKRGPSYLKAKLRLTILHCVSKKSSPFLFSQ